MAETSVTVVASKRDVLDPYFKILQNQSNENIDISFSSYLKPENNKQQQEKEQEDVELSIFEARRYFSESGNNDRSRTMNLNSPRASSVSSTKVSSFNLGHTASSEASWNSQTGLLCTKNRKESNRSDHGSSKKGGPRWFFLHRTCPCSSSKSVQVQETKSRIAESRTGSNRVVSNRIVHHNHQTISSSNPLRLMIPSNNLTLSIAQSRESKAHVSNFSFPTLNQISTSDEPIKPILNPIKPVLNPVSPKGVATDEEATSDASSDLFEIESFSAQPVALPRTSPADETANDEKYGYEASVVTVEAASTVATNFSRMGLESSAAASASLAFSGCDKIRTGLLNCRCEKTVMVNSDQRLVQPLKNVSVQNDVTQKVLCNNGSSKQSVTSRTMFDNKSSFLI